MSLRILQPGLQTTIQDQGRYGFRHQGVRVNGAMDRVAAQIANIIVGNARDAAVLEMTLLGPTIEFATTTLFALTGADLPATLDGQSVPSRCPWHAKPGQRLSCQYARTGCRAYLAAAGGFVIEPILGSCSADLICGYPGLLGRPLQAGDCLEIAATDRHSNQIINTRRYASTVVNYSSGEHRIRLLPGPQFDWLTPTAQEQLFNQPLTISNESDRMGYRLQGNPLQFTEPRELLSQAVTFGTVQVPAAGQPLILMADHPTTGGYPIVAQVAQVDLPLLAQAKPGETLRMERCTLGDAQSWLREQSRELRQLEHGWRQ